MAKRDDWQGNDWDDAPDYIRERMQGLARRRGSNLIALFNGLAVLTVLSGALYLLYARGPLRDWLAPPSSLVETVSPPAVAPDAYPIPQHLEPIQPSSTALQSSEPSSLADCIGADKVIDENVVRCRYGKLPRSAPPEQAQGMVNAQYLARYREEKTEASNPRRGSSAQVENDVQRIAKWSGGDTYQAAWQVLDNRIDYTSVCANHRRGSIDYRECRKGAKQFFKEQCRDWGKRWDADREPKSKRMEDRYCSASNGFSPMG
ncbi:hypothetical protein [Aquipseudomonas guryensis]|jgi:hypothetical protein|uniref:Uncharacterized protein n=1 Tax=Aquipseudomonas guryensis TaxID=2759165 RepID=A0A7W4H545_9GAMM|nr:hypothetical protein [Pseudomonas guryensis]MBB1521200.1 hypothetical protein [Pseudomonas guryensis]